MNNDIVIMEPNIYMTADQSKIEAQRSTTIMRVGHFAAEHLKCTIILHKPQQLLFARKVDRHQADA